MEIPTTLFYSKAFKTILKTYSVKDFKNTFQDKYKVTLITLTETLLLPYCDRLIDMFLFCRVLPYACNHSEDFWKKSLLKLPGIFKKIYGAVPPVSSCQNSNLNHRAIHKKGFSPFSYSEKMRWGRGWPKQLYVLFIGKPEILLKGTSGKILLFNIGNFIAKFKNVFCLLRTILENASPNN